VAERRTGVPRSFFDADKWVGFIRDGGNPVLRSYFIHHALTFHASRFHASRITHHSSRFTFYLHSRLNAARTAASVTAPSAWLDRSGSRAARRDAAVGANLHGQ